MFFLLFFATIKYLSDLALLLFNKQQKRPISESFVLIMRTIYFVFSLQTPKGAYCYKYRKHL